MENGGSRGEQMDQQEVRFSSSIITFTLFISLTFRSCAIQLSTNHLKRIAVS